MGQIAAFILIPGLLLLLRMSSAPFQMLDFTFQVLEVSLDILLLAIISVIAIFNFFHRAEAGKPPDTHNPDEIILLERLPSEQATSDSSPLS
jgi:hypothetical protein